MFIGPAAVFTNDLHSRSKHYQDPPTTTHLRTGYSIGANATILAGLEIGEWAMVGAGSVVTRLVMSHSLVMGSPARHRGWVCHCGARLAVTGDTETPCQCGRVFRLALSASDAPSDLIELGAAHSP